MYKQCKVVFDFDGTIIPDNIGFEFNKWLIQQSPLRSLLAIIFFPLICLLALHPSSIRLGMNIGCYIATAFETRSLFQLRRQFIHDYFKENQAGVYLEAVRNIRQHLQQGEQVLVVSGSQQWLVRAALKHLGIGQVKLIGSAQGRFLGGYILTDHCILENKISMARARGFEPENWQFAYTDSVQDLPMVQFCRQVYLINPSANTTQQFNHQLNHQVNPVIWEASPCTNMQNFHYHFTG